MVKLVYHTRTLGPIGLDYCRPVATVGSDPGNDLVLPHPSVRPRHCILEFLEDCVRLAPPPDGAVPDPAADALAGRQFFVGDQLAIGEVMFEIQPSGRTVVIPQYQPPREPEFVGTGPLYFCEHCQRSYPASTLTRIGLVGRPKRLLCPKCSRELVPPRQEIAAGGFLARVRRAFAGFGRWFTPRR